MGKRFRYFEDTSNPEEVVNLLNTLLASYPKILAQWKLSVDGSNKSLFFSSALNKQQLSLFHSIHKDIMLPNEFHSIKPIPDNPNKQLLTAIINENDFAAVTQSVIAILNGEPHQKRTRTQAVADAKTVETDEEPEEESEEESAPSLSP